MSIVDNGQNNKIVIKSEQVDIDARIDGNNNEVIIDENVKILNHLKIRITDGNCQVHIGKNSTIYDADIIINENNNFVTIGQDCMISDNVKILASDSHTIYLEDSYECINYHKQGITIGDHVWVGMNAIILKDSVIKSNSVVAAGAIVSCQAETGNVILGGVPAKALKTGINWDRKTPRKTKIAEELPNVKVNSEGTVRYFIEEDLEGKANIKRLMGWAYVEGFDSADSKIYIEVKSRKTRTYQAEGYPRKDIAESVDKKYLNSGFHIVLPKKISITKEEISLVIENQGNIYKTKIV